VRYVACATTSSPDRARANAWVDGLAAPSTLAIMRGAGFAPAPLT